MSEKRKNLLVIASSQKLSAYLDSYKEKKKKDEKIIAWLKIEQEKTLPAGFADGTNRTEIVGNLDELDSILAKMPIEEILFLPHKEELQYLPSILALAEREGIPLRLQIEYPEAVIKRIWGKKEDKNTLSVYLAMSHEDKWPLRFKRIMDIIIAGFLLSFTWPFFLIIAGLIKLTSSGPIFYEWRVIGQHKKPFRSWKFRTMIPEADQLKPLLQRKNIMKGPVFKAPDDPRITPFGRILRKYSLDEWPQLWSVIKGDMSLVGPRPAGPHELVNYEPWQRRRLSVKPGITCLWQVSGRNRITDFNDWVKMDFAYIDNWSLWLDIKILVKTILAIIQGTGI